MYLHPNKDSSDTFSTEKSQIHQKVANLFQPLLILLNLFTIIALGVMTLQNQMLKNEINSLKSSFKAVQSGSSIENDIEVKLPNQSITLIDETAGWIDKSFSIGTYRFSLRHPSQYFFDGNILSNYPMGLVREKSNLGFSETEGKCDFTDFKEDDSASSTQEVLKREQISSMKVNLVKVTVRDLNPGPSGFERYNYFLVDSDGFQMQVMCFGKWQEDDAEILSVLKTISPE